MSEKFIFILTLLIPGSGQFLNGEKKKGLFGIVYMILAWVSTIFALLPTLMSVAVLHTAGDYEGSITIGMTEMVDNSFYILVESIFAILVLVAFLLVACAFAYDAKRVRKAINEGETVLHTKERIKAMASDIIPHAVTMPAYVLMFLFMIVPAIVSIAIVFTNYKKPILPPAFLIQWVGFENFTNLFTDPSLVAVFKETFLWTFIWTFSATTLTIVLGTLLAVIMHNKKIKGKKFFRTIYLLPWAVPAFLTILIFQIFFSKVGAMNTIVLPFFTGVAYDPQAAIGFLIEPNLAKMTVILIQSWLGFPFIFVLITGILQAIPDDLYEAAGIDGGNSWTNFWDITFPMIMIAAAPMLITQYTFNFNNVTIIYILGAAVVKPLGAVYGPLETIASLGYQLTLDANYATAATFTLISSLIVSTIVLISWLKTGAFKNEEVM
ncbi:sugar ABC transporter permease [Mollicutes bacterium LVI A0078]|nr:sugar ABC transporter permease [Mollicutes bacterium LVI A0075]WOO90357.1 sugar ABC transporter permease [Mollicutes bacterium LVI A0078]